MFQVNRLSPDFDHVLISVNPNAGARETRPIAEALGHRLAQWGYRVHVCGEIEELVKRVTELRHEGRLRAVVAAGGDGTAALIANRTPSGTPLALLPLGTENLLSKYLSVVGDPQSVAEMIHAGLTTRLDAGRAGRHMFLLMVGCGFDADVVRRLHHERTGHIHHFSYAKPILDSIRNYQYPELRIYVEQPGRGADKSPVAGESERQLAAEPIRARWVFVVNLPKYAGGLSFVPDAQGTDGLLDVCTFKEGSLWHGLRYLSGVVTGQHRGWSDCQILKTRRLRIEADGSTPYQMDGDPGGFLPVDIEVLPGRLTLFVPQSQSVAEASDRRESGIGQ